jgi:hypothetical protein
MECFRSWLDCCHQAEWGGGCNLMKLAGFCVSFSMNTEAEITLKMMYFSVT